MKRKVSLGLVLLLLLTLSVTAQFSTVRIKIVLAEITSQVNAFVSVLVCLIWYLVAGLAAFLILWSGVKYLSSDDFEERNQAKKMLFRAITGLLIVLLACPLVNYLVAGTAVLEFNCLC